MCSTLSRVVSTYQCTCRQTRWILILHHKKVMADCSGIIRVVKIQRLWDCFRTPWWLEVRGISLAVVWPAWWRLLTHQRFQMSYPVISGSHMVWLMSIWLPFCFACPICFSAVLSPTFCVAKKNGKASESQPHSLTQDISRTGPANHGIGDLVASPRWNLHTRGPLAILGPRYVRPYTKASWLMSFLVFWGVYTWMAFREWCFDALPVEVSSYEISEALKAFQEWKDEAENTTTAWDWRNMGKTMSFPSPKCTFLWWNAATIQQHCRNFNKGKAKQELNKF